MDLALTTKDGEGLIDVINRRVGRRDVGDILACFFMWLFCVFILGRGKIGESGRGEAGWPASGKFLGPDSRSSVLGYEP